MLINDFFVSSRPPLNQKDQEADLLVKYSIRMDSKTSTGLYEQN